MGGGQHKFIYKKKDEAGFGSLIVVCGNLTLRNI